MLKFTVQQSDLFRCLTSVSRIIGKVKNEVLQNVKIKKINEEKILFCATNSETSLKYELLANNVEGEEIYFNLSNLLNIISRLNGDITIDNGQIKCGKNKFKIPFTELNNYPEINFISEDVGVMINAETLCKAINSTAYSCDTGNSILSGIKFNNTEIVSTDSRRISINKIDVNVEMILPKQLCEEIAKLFPLDKVLLRSNDKQIYITNGQITLIGHKLNGMYPKYEQLLPKECQFSFKFEKSKFLNAINVLIPVLDEHQMACKFTLEDNILKLNVFNGDSQGSTEFDVEGIKVPNTISFCLNAQYLLDALKTFDNEAIMELNNEKAPIVLKDEIHYSMIMPILLK